MDDQNNDIVTIAQATIMTGLKKSRIFKAIAAGHIKRQSIMVETIGVSLAEAKRYADNPPSRGRKPILAT